ncbi:Dabb family protein [Galbitalea sp. SE-J8]|uniref:Dabb family protein n=1 Tax=Galbitalea sp. SE-J8 TaxID=3054952 RepID=UPI00259D0C08|nr:Dabb family protein [Galbitalea sp. SE-J8]MDM4762384.1 Dabb family protein [Galbitalea sp. SE-J8]
MITHLVGWNLTAATDAERTAAAGTIRDLLEGLVGVVPGLIDLRVHRNGVGIEGNRDLALISHFESEDALHGYISHPEHQRAVEFIRANTTDRFSIDVVE